MSRDVSLRHSIFIHTHAHAHTDWHTFYCVWPHPHPYTNVWPEGGVVVLHVNIMYYCILTYKVSVSQLTPLASYVHKYSPIIMYGLGLFFVVLTRTTMFTTTMVELDIFVFSHPVTGAPQPFTLSVSTQDGTAGLLID